MNDLQAHRGPDDEGIWMRDDLGLGHRRLAVVDPGAAGRQPMSTRDGGLWITFNGEIHNHEELRADLSSAGIALRTRSDTEVLLEAYRRWGADCFSKLNGMWALALLCGDKRPAPCHGSDPATRRRLQRPALLERAGRRGDA